MYDIKINNHKLFFFVKTFILKNNCNYTIHHLNQIKRPANDMTNN